MVPGNARYLAGVLRSLRDFVLGNGRRVALGLVVIGSGVLVVVVLFSHPAPSRPPALAHKAPSKVNPASPPQPASKPIDEPQQPRVNHASGVLAANIPPPSPDNGWQLNGSAAWDSSSATLNLTPAANWTAGSAFYKTPFNGYGTISASFDYTMAQGTGADGITFAFLDATQGELPTALGRQGEGLGIYGRQALAAVFDTFYNSYNCDPSANFVGIVDAGVAGNGCNVNVHVDNPNVPPLRGTHHVDIVADPQGGTLQVSLDGSVVTLCTNVTYLPASVYLGFTSATGAENDVHSIANVSISVGPRRPLIFLPGVAGSEMFYRKDGPGTVTTSSGGTATYNWTNGEKIWIPTGLNPPGTPLYDPEKLNTLNFDNGIGEPAGKPQPLFDIGPASDYLVPDVYKDIIPFFTANGYVEGQNFFVLPYDWRAPIEDEAAALHGLVAQALTVSGADSVDIVAHSQGTLVTRTYLLREYDPNFNATPQPIAHVVMLTPPFLGSPKQTKVVTGGDCLKAPFAPKLDNCYPITPALEAKVLSTLPSAAELAPSRTYTSYFDGHDQAHPFPFIDDRPAAGYSTSDPYQTYIQALNQFGVSVWATSDAQAFHASDSSWIASLPVDLQQRMTILAGTGYSTPGQTRVSTVLQLNTYCPTLGVSCTSDITTRDSYDYSDVDGDGTVPRQSAALEEQPGQNAMHGAARVIYLKTQHAWMGANDQLVPDALKIIRNQQVASGTVQTPAGDFVISVHSPAELQVSDAASNVTGAIRADLSDVTINIPDSSYERDADAKIVRLGDGGVYSGKLVGTGYGEGTVRVRTRVGGIVTQTIIYRHVPLTAQAIATFTFDSGSNSASVLRDDIYGNGSAIANLSPSILTGAAANDSTPPNLSITSPPAGSVVGSPVAVSWSDSDAGSGVSGAYAQVDIAQHGQRLSSPGTVSLPVGPHTLDVYAEDAAGNLGHQSISFSVTDQPTGPAVLHVPVLSAFYGTAMPITLTSTCHQSSTCTARLFYRATDPSTAQGWTKVDMGRTGTTTLGGVAALSWSAGIPSNLATTTGVDYYLEADDNFAITRDPASTYLNQSPAPPGTNAGSPLWFHINVVSPPVLTHVPAPFGQSGVPIDLTLLATCSTPQCSATLFYSPTSGLATPLTSLPPWPSIPMVQAGSTSLGSAGRSLTFVAQITGSAVDTRGIDYLMEVTDGNTTAFSPGTTYQGNYAPTDGVHTGYWHVHVLEPTHIVHVPPATSAFRANIPVSAQGNCAGVACTATLYYRTTTSEITDPNPSFTPIPMAVTYGTASPLGRAITVAGTIPGSVADTRGVDYFFSVADGATTSWWPGTSSADGYAPAPGTRVGWWHVRVLDPPHLVPTPILTAPALQDLRVDTQSTCATPTCSVTLQYATSLVPLQTVSVAGASVLISNPTYKTLNMLPTAPPVASPLGFVATYEAVIPATDVTTAGLVYYIQANDGYTTAAAPGTEYLGAYTYSQGRILANFIVHVVEPPHPVHTPVAESYYQQPVPLEVRSNCSSPTCTALLTWRQTGAAWQTAPMSALPPIGTPLAGGIWTFDAVIPGTDATTRGIDYSIAVSDGYVVSTTPAFHDTVLTPTAILHIPVASSAPSVDIPIEAYVACATSSCNATLSYQATNPGVLTGAWTPEAMAATGPPTAVGSATGVYHFIGTIPAAAVTTTGVDYYLTANDGHTTAYAPGTAYIGTSVGATDGTSIAYFHIRVTEPIHYVHVPVTHAPPSQVIHLTALVNCATRSCTGTLAYRSNASILGAADLQAFELDRTPFQFVTMTQSLFQDLGSGGTLLQMAADIPASAVTVAGGVQYYLKFSDGSTNGYFPGTSYVGGYATPDGFLPASQPVIVNCDVQVNGACP